MLPFRDKTKPDIDASDTDPFVDRDKFDEVFFQQLDATDEGGQGKDISIRTFMLGEMRDKDDHPSESDIRGFYAGSVLRERLRGLVTRHPSEWGDAVDWKKLDSTPRFKHVPAAAKQAFRDELAKLAWWQKGFLSKQGLPQDQVVHHYHPIAFLAWLDEKREKDEDGKLHDSVIAKNHGTKPL